jgi:hypothetical protein
MKKVVFTLFLLLLLDEISAQESQTDYNFLRLPVSAHVAALGGDNISIDDDDPTVIFHNPALISNVTDKSINLNYMTYMEGTKTASASFVKALKERATWGVTAQYMDYGSIKRTDESGTDMGSFTPKDISLGGTFAYLLSDHIAGGVTAKFISSTIDGYSSLAVGVDLGLNYINQEQDWSVSAVARNLGGQVKAYNDDFEAIPLDIQLGASKRLGHSPFRFSMTLTKLNDWKEKFGHHLVIGADVILSEQLYLAVGYNGRRNSEMSVTSTDDTKSAHGAGFSIGGGLQLERFKLQLAYAKYHVSTSSLLINLTYTL